jgi:hypothetical protein
MAFEIAEVVEVAGEQTPKGLRVVRLRVRLDSGEELDVAPLPNLAKLYYPAGCFVKVSSRRFVFHRWPLGDTPTPQDYVDSLVARPKQPLRVLPHPESRDDLIRKGVITPSTK